MDLNNVSMTGRLTKNCQLKTTSAGDVNEFSIAVNGFKETDTVFLSCSLWGKQAITLEPYLLKGTRVAVSGALKQSKWQDREGKDHEKWSINVSQVALIGEKKPYDPAMDYVKKEKIDDVPF